MDTVQLLLPIALNANIHSTAEPVRICTLYMATTCLKQPAYAIHQSAAARSEGSTCTANRFRQFQPYVPGMLMSGLYSATPKS